MDKKKIQELMEKRNPMREVVKPVDFFEKEKNKTSKPVNQQASKPLVKNPVKKHEKKAIKYTTYLPEELITKIKMQAVLQKKKGYQIIIEALEKFFGK